MMTCNTWMYVRLLLRLRWARFTNQYAGSSYGGAGVAGRTATYGKRRPNGWIASVMAALFVYAAASIAWQALETARSVAGSVQSAAFAGIATVLLSLAVLAVLLLNIAQEAGELDSELEWLATMPAPMPAILAGRVIERTLMNSLGAVVLTPLLIILVWQAGHHYLALPAGFFLSLVLLAVIAIVRTVVDTGLRLAMPRDRLKSLQGMAAIGAVLILLVISAAAFGKENFAGFAWAAGAPGWMRWLPTGLAVHAFTSSGDPSIGALLLMLFETALVVAGGLLLLRWQLRHGVVIGKSQSSRRVQLPASNAIAEPRTAWRWLTHPVQARELRLLQRDRSLMLQSLVLPLVLGVAMFALQPQRFLPFGESAAPLAALVFFTGAMVLGASIFRTLVTEGDALWLLYTVPHPLVSILARKTRLWIGIASAYVVVAWTLIAAMVGHLPGDFLLCGVLALVGVALSGVTAAALGALGVNLSAAHAHQKLPALYSALHMLIMSIYVSAIWSQRFVLVLLFAMLAAALWQRASDHLPYILDPTAAPPSRLSVTNGLAAALALLALQTVIMIIFNHAVTSPPFDRLTELDVLLISTAAAAAPTSLIAWYVLRRRVNREELPKVPGAHSLRSGLLGLAAGGVAAAATIGYVSIAQRLSFAGLRLDPPVTSIVLFVAAILVLPICAEFVYRRLLFVGLRRSFNSGLAMVASAAVFTLLFPMALALPALMLGLAAAFVYERTGKLFAPIMAHATHNLLVLSVLLAAQ